MTRRVFNATMLLSCGKDPAEHDHAKCAPGIEWPGAGEEAMKDAEVAAREFDFGCACIAKCSHEAALASLLREREDVLRREHHAMHQQLQECAACSDCKACRTVAALIPGKPYGEPYGEPRP